MDAENADVAEEFYRSIDGDDYDALRGLLAPGFVHERPDRTIDGRDRFVRFMREERPLTDTSHAVDALYRNDEEVAVRGRLLRGEERLFRFVDVFSFEGGDVARLRTYTR